MPQPYFDQALFEFCDRRFSSQAAATQRIGQTKKVCPVFDSIARDVRSDWQDTQLSVRHTVRLELRGVYPSYPPPGMTRRPLVTNPDQFFVWCPTEREVLLELIEILRARCRMECSAVSSSNRFVPSNRFEVEDYYAGRWSADRLPGFEAQIDAYLKLHYAHLLRWVPKRVCISTRFRSPDFCEDRFRDFSPDQVRSEFEGEYTEYSLLTDTDCLQRAITLTMELPGTAVFGVDRAVDRAERTARLHARRERSLQQIEAWCAENGYTEPFEVDCEWWAFPPHSVTPMPLNLNYQIIVDRGTGRC